MKNGRRHKTEMARIPFGPVHLTVREFDGFEYNFDGQKIVKISFHLPFLSDMILNKSIFEKQIENIHINHSCAGPTAFHSRQSTNKLWTCGPLHPFSSAALI